MDGGVPVSGVDSFAWASGDVAASATSITESSGLGALLWAADFCFSPPCPTFTEVNSMVVFGIMTGGWDAFDGPGVCCCCSRAACGSGALLSAPVPAVSGVPGATPWAASDVSEPVLTWPPLAGRTRRISGLIVRFSPIGAAGASGASAGAAPSGTGVPQILQKRALATSSLLHLEQRFIS